MALTASVKEELSRLDIKKSSVRKAEVSAMLRFAGGLHIISGRIVIEAEVDLASTARRLRAAIAEVYGHQSEIIVVSAGGLRRASRYVVRVVRDGEALARQDRKSTRLNSSHANISYAVFCLKKKKNTNCVT